MKQPWIYYTPNEIQPEGGIQRQGVGTALMQAALERFWEVRQIILATDNTPKTIAFYESLGFVQMTKMGCCGFMKAW